MTIRPPGLCLKLLVAAVAAGALQVIHAQPAVPVASGSHQGQHAGSNAVASEFAEGEVRRIDKASGKITIRHGEIKSLSMPPMTMVFVASQPAMLDQVKVGDRIRFSADQSGGAYRVTAIQPAP